MFCVIKTRLMMVGHNWTKVTKAAAISFFYSFLTICLGVKKPQKKNSFLLSASLQTHPKKKTGILFYWHCKTLNAEAEINTGSLRMITLTMSQANIIFKLSLFLISRSSMFLIVPDLCLVEA